MEKNIMKTKNAMQMYIDGSVAQDMAVNELNERMRRLYKPSKIAFIDHVDDVLWKCWDDDDFVELFKRLKGTIKGKAIGWANHWYKNRLSVDDFESEFWEVAFKLSKEYYDDPNPDFYFFEMLTTALNSKAIDITRRVGAKKACTTYRAESLREGYENLYAAKYNDIEKIVTDRMLVKEIFGVESLTQVGKDVLKLIYECPQELSLREIGQLCGINHPQKVQRILDKVRRKLAHYEKDYNNDRKYDQLYGSIRHWEEC